MGTPFREIALYTPTPFKVGTPEFNEEISLINSVSELYVCNMNGYKPPKTTRITIQPAYHNIWNKTWRDGSLVSIAPFFSYAKCSAFDKLGKQKYILEIIQTATTQLSDEYQWDKVVFENAYTKTLSHLENFR